MRRSACGLGETAGTVTFIMVGGTAAARVPADAPSSGHSCLQDVIGGWPAAAAAAHASAESCAWAVVAHDQSTTAAAAALRSAAVIVPECDHCCRNCRRIGVRYQVYIPTGINNNIPLLDYYGQVRSSAHKKAPTMHPGARGL